MIPPGDEKSVGTFIARKSAETAGAGKTTMFNVIAGLLPPTSGRVAYAGAVVTGETLRRAHALELSPASFLRHNDSYHFFAALNDLIQPGPTGTNVNDLLFMFTF